MKVFPESGDRLHHSSTLACAPTAALKAVQLSQTTTSQFHLNRQSSPSLPENSSRNGGLQQQPLPLVQARVAQQLDRSQCGRLYFGCLGKLISSLEVSFKTALPLIPRCSLYLVLSGPLLPCRRRRLFPQFPEWLVRARQVRGLDSWNLLRAGHACDQFHREVASPGRQLQL